MISNFWSPPSTSLGLQVWAACWVGIAARASYTVGRPLHTEPHCQHHPHFPESCQVIKEDLGNVASSSGAPYLWHPLCHGGHGHLSPRGAEVSKSHVEFGLLSLGACPFSPFLWPGSCGGVRGLFGEDLLSLDPEGLTLNAPDPAYLVSLFALKTRVCPSNIYLSAGSNLNK